MWAAHMWLAQALQASPCHRDMSGGALSQLSWACLQDAAGSQQGCLFLAPFCCGALTTMCLQACTRHTRKIHGCLGALRTCWGQVEQACSHT